VDRVLFRQKKFPMPKMAAMVFGRRDRAHRAEEFMLGRPNLTGAIVQDAFRILHPARRCGCDITARSGSGGMRPGGIRTSSRPSAFVQSSDAISATRSRTKGPPVAIISYNVLEGPLGRRRARWQDDQSDGRSIDWGVLHEILTLPPLWPPRHARLKQKWTKRSTAPAGRARSLAVFGRLKPGSLRRRPMRSCTR